MDTEFLLGDHDFLSHDHLLDIDFGADDHGIMDQKNGAFPSLVPSFSSGSLNMYEGDHGLDDFDFFPMKRRRSSKGGPFLHQFGTDDVIIHDEVRHHTSSSYPAHHHHQQHYQQPHHHHHHQQQQQHYSHYPYSSSHVGLSHYDQQPATTSSITQPKRATTKRKSAGQSKSNSSASSVASEDFCDLTDEELRETEVRTSDEAEKAKHRHRRGVVCPRCKLDQKLKKLRRTLQKRSGASRGAAPGSSVAGKRKRAKTTASVDKPEVSTAPVVVPPAVAAAAVPVMEDCGASGASTTTSPTPSVSGDDEALDAVTTPTMTKSANPTNISPSSQPLSFAGAADDGMVNKYPSFTSRAVVVNKA